MDMLCDGITPVSAEIVTAFLRLCEAHKKFLFSLAGLLDGHAEALREARRQAAEQAPAPVAEAAPEAAAPAREPHPAEDAPREGAHHEEEPHEDAAKAQEKAGHPAKAQTLSSIRVGTERLDRLIELVGKLMVTYAVIAQGGQSGAKSVASLRELDSVIASLQTEVEAIRLVPLKQILVPLHRLVKSVSQKVGKKVRLEVAGDELALDKSIVECLSEPLVHLVRNAVDHGLETPQDRAGLGKPEEGVVRINAFRKGETAFVEVCDDGRGLDPARIRGKAVEKGLIAEADALSEQETFALVLRSGFSTAEQVTDVSGRGVGMDAVLNVVRNTLAGEIGIASRQGRGATFTITIPLSRSVNEGIVDALVCRVGSEVFVLPSRDVVEIYVPRKGDIVSLPDGREAVEVRGVVHGLLRLDALLGLESAGDEGRRVQAVVVRAGETHAAILVDEVLRQQQVVITGFTVPVAEVFRVPILGFGMMGESDALVLDIEALLAGLAPAGAEA
jgi:two-component system chemotaxis sensor kinase CheA